jgi:hypothetical protein
LWYPPLVEEWLVGFIQVGPRILVAVGEERVILVNVYGAVGRSLNFAYQP